MRTRWESAQIQHWDRPRTVGTERGRGDLQEGDGGESLWLLIKWSLAQAHMDTGNRE